MENNTLLTGNSLLYEDRSEWSNLHTITVALIAVTSTFFLFMILTLIVCCIRDCRRTSSTGKINRHTPYPSYPQPPRHAAIQKLYDEQNGMVKPGMVFLSDMTQFEKKDISFEIDIDDETNHM
ncbi:unnamed protein product [Owenia fusiformis]|uniref:Uncharacterized protein n=1 Tax=Owenia fusiformis TaxID=6347 RepID=A0A8J1UFW8_OWEFU|nr:unnamed protein product [Owenia fusiformis]